MIVRRDHWRLHFGKYMIRNLDSFETYLQARRSNIPGILKSSSRRQKQSSAFQQGTFRSMKKGCQYYRMYRRACTIDSFDMAVVEYSKDSCDR